MTNPRTSTAPDTVSGAATVLAQYEHAERLAERALPNAADQPVPHRIVIEGLHRLLDRLRTLAEEWTADATRHYSGELVALLPQLSPSQARVRFEVYADAVHRLSEYDDMSEAERRDEWGPEHICERANFDTDRELALSALVHGHPYHPAWRAETFADPIVMADLITELQAEVTTERTEHAKTKHRYHAALDANDSLTELAEILTDTPVPYVTAHLALVPALPDQAATETAATS